MPIISNFPGGGTDLSDATAIASQVLSGSTFFTSGSDDIQTGTMINYKDSLLTSSSYSITGSAIRFNTPNTGYMVEGSTGLQVSYSSLATLLGLTSSKLVTGNTVLGIAGSSPPALNGTATTSYVLSGYTFGSSASSSLQTGSMTSYSGSLLTSTTYNLDTTNSLLRLYTPNTGYMVSGSTALTLSYANLRTLIGLSSASQIVTGNTILGLAGTSPPALSGTATTSYVLSGYTFGSSASSSLQTGAMSNYSGSVLTASSYTNTSSTSASGYQRLYVPSTGYYVGGSTIVQLLNSTLASSIGLTAAKLVMGNTVLGITGTRSEVLTTLFTGSTNTSMDIYVEGLNSRYPSVILVQRMDGGAVNYPSSTSYYWLNSYAWENGWSYSVSSATGYSDDIVSGGTTSRGPLPTVSGNYITVNLRSTVRFATTSYQFALFAVMNW